MVEFAICVMALLALTVGAVDFGRVFVEATILTGASASGAMYGYRKTADAGNAGAIQTVVEGDTAALPSVSTESDIVCSCPSDPDNLTVDCATAACSGGGTAVNSTPRVYVKVSATRTFTTLAPWPFIPSSVNVGGVSYLRVQ